MSGAIIIYSGGLDSTVLLHDLLTQFTKVHALGINYGQRHHKELTYAARMCRHLGVPFDIADLSGLKRFLSGSSQTDDSVAVPHGHYADESMKLTVVPNRNMLMLSVAIASAISKGVNTVAYAAHRGDHPIYPDCRPPFIGAMNRAAELCSFEPVHLLAPYQLLNKTEIVQRGATLGVPFDKTWSCYQGEDLHCGKCGTCVERREAFTEAQVEDPTEYQK